MEQHRQGRRAIADEVAGRHHRAPAGVPGRKAAGCQVPPSRRRRSPIEDPLLLPGPTPIPPAARKPRRACLAPLATSLCPPFKGTLTCLQGMEWVCQAAPYTRGRRVPADEVAARRRKVSPALPGHTGVGLPTTCQADWVAPAAPRRPLADYLAPGQPSRPLRACPLASYAQQNRWPERRRQGQPAALRPPPRQACTWVAAT